MNHDKFCPGVKCISMDHYQYSPKNSIDCSECCQCELIEEVRKDQDAKTQKESKEAFDFEFNLALSYEIARFEATLTENRIAQLENTHTLIFNTHYVMDCGGQPCTLHGRTNHSMRDWPQSWNLGRGLMERVCPHEIGHPDPDELSHVDRSHNCDGCCNAQTEGTT